MIQQISAPLSGEGNNLGFSNIAFHKDWFLLSVLKK